MLEAAFWGAYIGIHIAVGAVSILHGDAAPPKDVYTYGDPAAIVEAAEASAPADAPEIAFVTGGGE